jgi:hypothetical protein
MWQSKYMKIYINFNIDLTLDKTDLFHFENISSLS